MKKITQVFLLLIIIFGSFMYIAENVKENETGISVKTIGNTVEKDLTGKQEELQTATENIKEEAGGTNLGFEVHYLDVGQADAAVVWCDNKIMLIDGGNVEDSSLIVSYLKKHNVSHINYIVGTHAHEDHIGGLAGALSVVSVGTVLAPETEENSEAYNNFKRKVQEKGLEITTPKAGDRFMLGSSNVEIFAPITEKPSDINNTSVVFKITYGDTSFLFTGDAEREEEQEIIDAGYNLKSTVMKAGHHGSETSTSYVFLREVMPEYVIISVGKNNSYGHPAEEVLSRFRDSNTKVFRTDLQGDIIVKSDGAKVTVIPARNADVETNHAVNQKVTEEEKTVQSKETSGEAVRYIANINTYKFHYPQCRSVKKMKDSNKKELYCSRSEAVSQGYSPCGNCNP